MAEQRTDMEWLSRYEKLKAEAQGQEVKSKRSRVFWMVKKEAKLGNKYAQKWLGDLYWEVEYDYTKACEWYKKAAEQKNVDAYIALTKETFGWERREWYKKAAEAGNMEAQIWMGREWTSYSKSKEEEKDKAYDLALDWYLKAARQGSAEAQYEVGRFLEFGLGVEVNYEIALEWYRAAAEQEYEKAQYRVAYFYEKGLGTEQDYKKAMEWYLKALEDKYCREARYRIGRLYEEGHGVEQDYARALEWYLEAKKEEDSVSAMYRIGYFYEQGYGVTRNLDRAIEMYKEISYYHIDAIYRLCYLYENIPEMKQCFREIANLYVRAGELWFERTKDDTLTREKAEEYRENSAIDYQKAMQYYLKDSQEADSDPAGKALDYIHISYMYEQGLGVDADDNRAEEYERKAHGIIPEAELFCRVGFDFEKGFGVSRDMRKAVQWYEKAAALRVPEAMLALGRIYEYGVYWLSEEKSEDEAVNWYIKAIGLGDEETCEKAIEGLSQAVKEYRCPRKRIPEVKKLIRKTQKKMLKK